MPDIDELPNYVNNISVDDYKFDNTPIQQPLSLNTETWKWFEVGKLFNMIKGNTILSDNEKRGNIPLISSTASNNGTSFFAKNDNIPFTENKITVASNGSVGSTFYQPTDFYTTADIIY